MQPNFTILTTIRVDYSMKIPLNICLKKIVQETLDATPDRVTGGWGQLTSCACVSICLCRLSSFSILSFTLRCKSSFSCWNSHTRITDKVPTAHIPSRHFWHIGHIPSSCFSTQDIFPPVIFPTRIFSLPSFFHPGHIPFCRFSVSRHTHQLWQ